MGTSSLSDENLQPRVLVGLVWPIDGGAGLLPIPHGWGALVPARWARARHY